MITVWDIYLIGIMDSLSVCSGILAFLLLCLTVAAFVCVLYLKDAGSPNVPAMYRKAILCGAAFVVLFVVAFALPTSKTLAAMYTLPVVVNNEKIQTITGNGLEILEKLTQDYLSELQDKKEPEKP